MSILSEVLLDRALDCFACFATVARLRVGRVESVFAKVVMAAAGPTADFATPTRVEATAAAAAALREAASRDIGILVWGEREWSVSRKMGRLGQDRGRTSVGVKGNPRAGDRGQCKQSENKMKA